MLCFEVFGTCRSGFGVLFLLVLVLITVDIGWERCGHGLTSRPCESSSEEFLNRLLVLFGYPDGSAAALLAGDLPLRYCSARFGWELPTWRLPDRVVFVNWLLRVLMVLGSLVVSGWVGICFLLLIVVLVYLLRIGFWGRRRGRALKEFDSTEKHQHTLHELGTA